MTMRATGRNAISHGFVAGLIGFAAVAAVFAAANIVAGRSPLYTAALLGASLSRAVTDPAQLPVTAMNVLAYTGLHLAVFLALGVAASALAVMADQGWQLWFVALFFFIFITFHLIAAVQVLAAPVQSVMPAVEIWGAGLAASAAMGAYLAWVHPRLRARQAW